MTITDPQPKDKRTKAYKDWVKRETHRKKMSILEGSISVKGFRTTEDTKKLSWKLASVREQLTINYPVSRNLDDTVIDENDEDFSGVYVSTNYLSSFKRWAFTNILNNNNEYSMHYPSFREEQSTEAGNPTNNWTDSPFNASMNQCNWSLIPKNTLTKCPVQRWNNSNNQNEIWVGGNKLETRWSPLVSAQTSNRAMGLFPPTFWPTELGDMPKDDKRVYEVMSKWVEDLVVQFFTTPPHRTSNITSSFAVDEYNQLLYRLAQQGQSRNSMSRDYRTFTTTQELLEDKEGKKWFNNQVLTLMITIMQEMILANTLYSLVFDKELSKYSQWVVLNESTKTGSEDPYTNSTAANLVMPYELWVKQIVAKNMIANKHTNESITEEDFLTNGFDDLSQQELTQVTRSYGTRYGVLSLRFAETVTFDNPINSKILTNIYGDLAKIWWNQQTEVVSDMNTAIDIKSEKVDTWLKETEEKLTNAKPLCEIAFTQQVGPRGGVYDGYSTSLTMGLNPKLQTSRYGTILGEEPDMITTQQQEKLGELYLMAYKKFVNMTLPTESSEIIFRYTGGQEITYEEAKAITGEDRSHGSRYKYNALNKGLRILGYPTYVDMSEIFQNAFVPVQDRLLRTILSHIKEGEGGEEIVKQMIELVPTRVSIARRKVEDDAKVARVLQSYRDVEMARAKLRNTESNWNVTKVVTKEQQKLILEKCVPTDNQRASQNKYNKLAIELGLTLPTE
jgi:hypothetical protein